MIAHALKHEDSALAEVVVDRQELAMPPTIALEQMASLSLFRLKAVLRGPGDEAIDLARSTYPGKEQHRSSASYRAKRKLRIPPAPASRFKVAGQWVHPAKPLE
jgi:hypothetical protein